MSPSKEAKDFRVVNFAGYEKGPGKQRLRLVSRQQEIVRH